MHQSDIDRILAILARPGMNKVLLAEAADVHRNTLDDVGKDGWNPMMATFRKIMDAVEKLERALG